uniref:CRIB domain-containing protein n=1 Tax=Heterorhabditis bacteriophora TaxID=37862 RepID=A0A1I7X2J0_HETBA
MSEDPSLYELTEVYAIPMSVRAHILSNNNIEKTRKTVRPPNNISDHLSTGEKQSIFAYLGNRARKMRSGKRRKLESYVISKIITLTRGIDFETRATSHPHFVIFVVETSSREVYGLNFYDVEEARSFHETVTTQRIIKMERRKNRMMSQGSIPKRRAPSPPKIGVISSDTFIIYFSKYLTSSICSLQLRCNYDTLVHLSKSYYGIQLLNIAEGSLFGFLTIRRKKKKRANIQISEPTDFHHLEHIGLDSLSPDQKETFSELVREVDRNSIRPTELFVRGQPSALADTRSSLMFSNKQQRRTPREIKKGSTNKVSYLSHCRSRSLNNNFSNIFQKNEYDNLQINPVTFKSNSTYDDLLNPDWDSAPVYSIPYNNSFLLEPAPQCEKLKIEQPVTDKPTQVCFEI